MTREEAMEIMDKMPLCNECDNSNFPYTCVECGDAFLKAMEALRQPEIVRCKDCAHGSLWCGNIKCVKPGMKKYEMDLHPVNWFCADGERRTDDA